MQVHTLEEAVRCALPDQIHRNNHALFVLARAVKSLELQHGEFSPEQLRQLFAQWHAKAVKFLRLGQTKEDYFVEFLIIRLAKHPLGSAVIGKAWKLAQERPLPPEALEFETPQLQLLVALCFQLHIANNPNPFYLSSRTCQKLFGHESHSTAAKWLRSLCALKIIVEVEKGDAKRATRYRYYVKHETAMNAEALIREATRRGLCIEVYDADTLAVSPDQNLDSEFEMVLRQHKAVLLQWLKVREMSVRHLARQVLAGEFEGAGRSTSSLPNNGLRSIAHPLCRRALARIEPKRKTRNT